MTEVTQEVTQDRRTWRARLQSTVHAHHYVYQFWAGDVCVYVGMTANLGRRWMEHQAGSPWFEDDVTHITATRYRGRARAQDAELALIHQLQPLHNRQGIVPRPIAGQPR